MEINMNSGSESELKIEDKLVEPFRPVKILQMTQVLFIPLFGILLAGLIIIGEFLSQRVPRKQLNQKTRTF